MEPDLDFPEEPVYYYIKSYDHDNDYCIDYSLFTLEEWNDLSKKSEVLERYADCCNDGETPHSKREQELASAAYFFYYSPFCKWEKGVNRLEGDEVNQKKFQQLIYMQVEEGNLVTKNKFRKWISENYTKFLECYELVKR